MSHNWKGFKPSLLPNDEADLNSINYRNKFHSDKKDGLRLELINKGVYGRSLKPINNTNIQNKFRAFCKTLPDNIIVEAELWSPELECREISGVASSDDHEVIKSLNAYCFDVYDYSYDYEFGDRVKKLRKIVENFNSPEIIMLRQTPLANRRHLEKLNQMCLDAGGEGSVVKDCTATYKKGRITIKSGKGFKLKEFVEEDYLIIGVTERMLNTNESTKDFLGHSVKRNTVADKEATGIAATFIIALEGYKGPIPVWEYNAKDDTMGKVTVTGDYEARKEIWTNRKLYISQWAVTKAMATGKHKKLRHPTLLGIKHKVEK